MSIVDPRGTGFSLEALARTLESGYGANSDADLSDDLRFVRGVADLARTRYFAHEETQCDQPIVFLLHPHDPEINLNSRAASKRIPMLDDGRHEISRRIWFVNHVVNEGISVELHSGEDSSDIFAFVRGAAGLGEIPAAVVTLGGDELTIRFYPAGLDVPSSCHRSDLKKADLPLSEVKQVLDGLYEAELATPDAQGHVGSTWKDANHLVPIRDAELMVQRILKAGLTGRYLGVFNILQEQSSVAGRYDLLIEQPDPSDRTSVTRHVLLELKVLREKTSGGKTVSKGTITDALEKGVRQAKTYRRQWSARSAALCCYDMRKDVRGSEMFADIASDASDASIELWCWHLFPSAEAYRQNLERTGEI